MTLHYKVTPPLLQRASYELSSERCRLGITEKYKHHLLILCNYCLRVEYGVERVDRRTVERLLSFGFINMKGELTGLGKEAVSDLMWRMRYIAK